MERKRLIQSYKEQVRRNDLLFAWREKRVMHDALTIEQVKVSWEQIRRTIKGREHGAKIAALLAGCDPVRIEQEQGVPCVVIRGKAAFHVRMLQTVVDLGVVAWGISQVVGQTCLVRLEFPEVSNGVQGEHDRLHLPAPRFVFPLHMPLDFSEVKEHWMDVTRALARQPKGTMLALALAQCVPVRLQTDEAPWLLVCTTSDPLAFTVIDQAAQDGTLAVALLPILGHVCRVRVEQVTPEQRAS